MKIINKYNQIVEWLSYKATDQLLLRKLGINFSVWEYGTCDKRKARKHKLKNNVQFVLWKKGKQGHNEDCWHDFDHSWWNLFIKH